MTRRLKAVFGLLVLAAAVPVSATTVRRLANAELTSQADLIVIGRAVDSRTQWIERNLFTIVTIEVSDTLKGSGAQRVEVFVPGGIDSNRKFPVAVTYPGAPIFAPNEDVFLFLVSDEDTSAYAVAGFSQGKLSIVEDNQGVKRVSRDLTKVDVQDAGGVMRGTRTFQPLADFIDEVRANLAATR